MNCVVEVTYALNLVRTGRPAMVFPDTDMLYLDLMDVNYKGTDIVQDLADLIRKTRKLVIDDYNDYMSVNDSLLYTKPRYILDSSYLPEAEILISQNILNTHFEGGKLMKSNEASQYQITGFYKKNAVVTDFHTEDFQCVITKTIDKDLTENQILGEHMYLNALAEKSIVIAMTLDGVMSEDIKLAKLKAIESKLQLARKLLGNA